MKQAALAGAAAATWLTQKRAALRARQDAERLLTQSTDVSLRFYRKVQLAGLPVPVQRYFRHVLLEGQPYLCGLRLQHGAEFKTDLKKDWIPIAGEQYIRADPARYFGKSSRAKS